jgi:hypothetical protein
MRVVVAAGVILVHPLLPPAAQVAVATVVGMLEPPEALALQILVAVAVVVLLILLVAQVVPEVQELSLLSI